MTKVISRRSRVAVILSLAVLAAANIDARVVVRRPSTDDTRARATFQERLDAYAAMHRRLAATLPTRAWRDHRHLDTISSAYLAAAIRAARATARQGDIFTSEASLYIRLVIRDTTSAAALGMSASLMDEDGRLLPGIHPDLHTALPAWETRELPASTLMLMPSLPCELEYRLVDYDLVLWDVAADLIVDVLPFAVAHPEDDVLYR